MTGISTHVLDAALGRPAAGLAVLLTTPSGTTEPATTDTDGRVRFAARLDPGDGRLVLATGPWFDAQGRATLYPEVTIDFRVAPGQAHYHLALLLSPFSYTTYRGS